MSNLRWNCAEDGCYCDTLPDWSIFNGLLPRGIRFTDVDGEIEIGGRFLRVEWKKPGALVPDGQLRALRAAANTGAVTVVIVWGETNPMRPTHWRLVDGEADSGKHEITLPELQEFVTAWGRVADGART